MSSEKPSKKPSRRQVKRALNSHSEELGQHENVVGMGMVRLDEEAQKSSGSEYAVAVYVRQKVLEEELSPEEVIPQQLEIKVRGGVIQVPTKVIEQGEVSLEAPDEEPLDSGDKEPKDSVGKESL